jgi:hypothetical protein
MWLLRRLNVDVVCIADWRDHVCRIGKKARRLDPLRMRNESPVTITLGGALVDTKSVQAWGSPRILERKVVRAARVGTDTGPRLRRGDTSDEIFLLGLAFGADGERVERAVGQREFQRFVLTIPQRSLAENFHSDHGLSCCLHLF